MIADNQLLLSDIKRMKMEHAEVFLAGVVGPWQIILIVLVVLLLFGGKKIPELMRGLGRGMKEFKDASGQGDEKNEKGDSPTTKE